MLQFQLIAKKIPVTFALADGKTEELELCELSAEARDQYMDSMSGRMNVVDGKVIGVKKFDGMQADLLGRCLYRGGKLVDRSEIQKWPSSVTTALFKEAQKLNILMGEDVASKNE